ncbi:MAG: glutamine--fructose-6-phosphate transaminase (isomerizing) [Chromatiales bacterium 21-64-14]|nr:MAG: glutamine--fructose-6-phosphate transaminase (isomerizing) [Chromatiales bacterium 21-64-14]HQU16247.1 glutamine--fructose-6-phosphate transaminase (isomerizing) [Gammaproteobacteria bacterium]
MCGIVGAVAQRDVAPILLEGLKRLEYRGYDSAGIAVLGPVSGIERIRTAGKVRQLEDALSRDPLPGVTGIAHTRWATHGAPSERNAHPHISCDSIAVVHNGIIENYEALRTRQREAGYRFDSDTDSEVIAHQIHLYLSQSMDLLAAVRAAVADLEGAYALGVICTTLPGELVAARRGSPLVIGIGIGEHFIASDVFALLPVTQRFLFLEDGDVAHLTRDKVTVCDAAGASVSRAERISELSVDSVERGEYRHYMLKEIFEQPRAISDTLEGRISSQRVLDAAFGPGAEGIFDTVRGVQIVACGTSYHAGLVARYWMESIAGLPCAVEVASEFRYRRTVVPPGTLFVTLSQSGETADTLAALRAAQQLDYVQTLAICNAPESSLVRESGLTLMTHAGPEIGVASTKAFTTQLTALLLLVVCLARRQGLSGRDEAHLVSELRGLPGRIDAVLGLNGEIEAIADEFADKHNALFLGRGAQYPVAMEGALKLKEISYIHAEAYPAGELKHGPLALVDASMPVIAVAPNNQLLEKLKSNLQEVRARGGQLYVFADEHTGLNREPGTRVLPVAPTGDVIAPIVFTVPLQLLAYHVAVLKGTDVDQPRNLAKSVTVE